MTTGSGVCFNVRVSGVIRATFPAWIYVLGCLAVFDYIADVLAMFKGVGQ